MKILVILALFFLSFSTPHPSDPDKPSNELVVELKSGSKIVTRNLGNGLLLRVVKDRSVKDEHIGWIIEVVERPYRPDSRNLAYQNETGSTADLSQVYAWQVGSQEFPNARRLEVKGRPLVLTVRLVNALTEGLAEDARFVSGKLKITWEWDAG